MLPTIIYLFQKVSFPLQLKPSVTFTSIIFQLRNKANSTTRLKVSPLSYAKHFESFISIDKHTLNKKTMICQAGQRHFYSSKQIIPIITYYISIFFLIIQ